MSIVGVTVVVGRTLLLAGLGTASAVSLSADAVARRVRTALPT